MIERLLTVRQVAEHLQTNVNYVYRLKEAGLLKFIKLGSLKCRESELQRFMNDNEGMDLTDPLHVRALDND